MIKDEDYKKKFYLNMVIFFCEIILIIILLNIDISCKNTITPKCSTKFDCTTCIDGFHECKTMFEDGDTIEDIICPCE